MSSLVPAGTLLRAPSGEQEMYPACTSGMVVVGTLKFRGYFSSTSVLCGVFAQFVE